MAEQVAQQPATPQRTAPQRSTAARQQVRRFYSMPYIPQKVTLNSRHSQDLFERSFRICADSLLRLAETLKFANISEENANKLSSMIQERFDNVLKELKADNARLDKLTEENGIDISIVRYSDPLTFDADINSTQIAVFVSILREFDAFMARMDALWLSGILPDKAYSRETYIWKRRILRTAGDVNRLRFTAYKMINNTRSKPQRDATESKSQANQPANTGTQTPEASQTQVKQAEPVEA